MNTLRSILIGILLGGAFGAKLGAYISLVSNISVGNWSHIELGFYCGAGLGCVSAIVVAFVRSGVLTKNNFEVRSAQLFTKAA